MPVSPLQAAKRALVTLLLALAAAYNVAISINRDSEDEAVKKAFRRVILKAHPDKGGAASDFRDLNNAREAWTAAAAAQSAQGQPRGPGGAGGASSSTGQGAGKGAGKGAGGASSRTGQGTGKGKGQSKGRGHRTTTKGKGRGSSSSRTGSSVLSQWHADKKSYRICGEAILLTYQSWPGNLAASAWKAFLAFLHGSLVKWAVRRWAATMETNEDGRVHLHLMLQFRHTVDRVATGFIFQGRRPNVSTNDYCGEGFCKKKMQQSIDRGMFYVWAEKIGTLHVAANYEPCWTKAADKYQVLGAWPEKLWKQRKLTTAKFEQYLFLTRDGVVFRKRNLDAVRDHEQEEAEEQEIQATTQRIRSNPSLYQAFPEVPVALRWLALFASDRIRYPLLLVLGASFTGKTEWAKSLFQNFLELKIGTLASFPDAMRKFDRHTHDGLILDDVRDLAFLADNQEKLQGKYDGRIEFASTPGGTCAYRKYLFATPVVVTANHSTRNLSFLDEHDWLSKADNCWVLNFPDVLHTEDWS